MRNSNHIFNSTSGMFFVEEGRKTPLMLANIYLLSLLSILHARILMMIDNKRDMKDKPLILLLGLLAFQMFLYQFHMHIEIAVKIKAILLLVNLQLYGPLFLYYTKLNLTSEKLGVKDLLYLLPVVIFVISSVYTDSSSYADIDSLYGIIFMSNHIKLKILWAALIIASLIIPITKAYILYIQLNYSTKRDSDNSMSESLSVKSLLLAFSVFTIFLMLMFLVTIFFKIKLEIQPKHIYAIAIITYSVVYAFSVAYKKKQLMISGFHGTGDANMVLSNEKSNALLINELKTRVEEDKLYLKHNLTLNDIAEHTSIPKQKVSFLLNKVMNINFYTFVNNYRVNEVKRRLQMPSSRDKSLVEISEECGFTSKSSFNAAFKMITNETPSDFKRNRIGTH